MIKDVSLCFCWCQYKIGLWSFSNSLKKCSNVPSCHVNSCENTSYYCFTTDALVLLGQVSVHFQTQVGCILYVRSRIFHSVQMSPNAFDIGPCSVILCHTTHQNDPQFSFQMLRVWRRKVSTCVNDFDLCRDPQDSNSVPNYKNDGSNNTTNTTVILNRPKMEIFIRECDQVLSNMYL